MSKNSVTDPAFEPAGGGVGAREDRLRGWEWVIFALTLTLMLWVTIGFLPPGICFDDFGDFQLACQTLGIMHPPGYPGFVTLGYFATKIPGVDPAYSVSLMCLAVGIASLALCILIQVRLNVNMLLACASALLLLAHPKVWINLVAPEIYGLTLLFVLAAVYCLVEYSRRGGRRPLVLAALCYGVAMANRPTVLLILPFVLVVWWTSARRWELGRRRMVQSLALAAGIALVPVFYNFAFMVLRDQPTTAYNYVERYNKEMNILPDASLGFSASIERAIWQGTARQFGVYFGDNAEGMRKKLRWLRHSIFDYSWDTILRLLVSFWMVAMIVAYPYRRYGLAWRVSAGVAGLAAVALTVSYYVKGQLADLPVDALVGLPELGSVCLVVFGAVATARRCSAVAWLFAGMITAGVAFVCMYRVFGQSADLLPFLVGSVVFASVGLSSLLRRFGPRADSYCGLFLLLVMCGATVADAPDREDVQKRIDATEFLTKLDIKSLPQGAVICTIWRYWPPLRGAQLAQNDRSDIEVIFGDRHNWRKMRAGLEHRPIFLTNPFSGGSAGSLVPYRNIWRLDPAVPEPADR